MKIKNIDDEITTRKRSISFKDVIYYSSYRIYNNYSYNIANSHLKIKNILDVSKTALINKKNNIDCKYFKQLNKELIDCIYKNHTQRILAIDGSRINLLESLNTNYKLSSNRNYTSALISSIYDVENKIPINYEIYDSFNERAALTDQLNYCKHNDILIMDRGYYSDELLQNIIDKKLNVLFRLKDNYKFVKDFINLNVNDHEFNYKFKNKKDAVRMRLIKYKIRKETYYLLTNLIDKNKYGLEYLKDLYKKRWEVETDFKYSKLYLSLENINSRKINQTKQDVYVHNFIQIIDGFLKMIIDKYNKTKNDNYMYNKKNSLYICLNKLMYILFYKKFTKKTIEKILKLTNIIKDSLVNIQNNRKYSRIRKRPASKWCLNAIKLLYRSKNG